MAVQWVCVAAGGVVAVGEEGGEVGASCFLLLLHLMQLPLDPLTAVPVHFSGRFAWNKPDPWFIEPALLAFPFFLSFSLCPIPKANVLPF